MKKSITKPKIKFSKIKFWDDYETYKSFFERIDKRIHDLRRDLVATTHMLNLPVLFDDLPDQIGQPIVETDLEDYLNTLDRKAKEYLEILNILINRLKANMDVVEDFNKLAGKMKSFNELYALSREPRFKLENKRKE